MNGAAPTDATPMQTLPPGRTSQPDGTTGRRLTRCIHDRPVGADGSGCALCGGTAQLAEARAARDAAMVAQLGRTAAGQDRAVIDQAIRHLARLGKPFSANDVRQLLPAVAPNLIGARFNAAARSGLIEACGIAQASHAAGHGRLLRLWRGTRQP